MIHNAIAEFEFSSMALRGMTILHERTDSSLFVTVIIIISALIPSILWWYISL